MLACSALRTLPLLQTSRIDWRCAALGGHTYCTVISVACLAHRSYTISAVQVWYVCIVLTAHSPAFVRSTLAAMQSALLRCSRLRSLVLRHCWAASPRLFARLRAACPLLEELTVDECDTSRCTDGLIVWMCPLCVLCSCMGSFTRRNVEAHGGSREQ